MERAQGVVVLQGVNRSPKLLEKLGLEVSQEGSAVAHGVQPTTPRATEIAMLAEITHSVTPPEKLRELERRSSLGQPSYI